MRDLSKDELVLVSGAGGSSGRDCCDHNEHREHGSSVTQIGLVNLNISDNDILSHNSSSATFPN